MSRGIERASLAAIIAATAMHPGSAAAQRRAGESTGPIEISGVNDSECSITTGEPSIGGSDGRYSAIIPISLACNTPFTLHGEAAKGAFQMAAADGISGGFTPVAYDVVWPASLVDTSGAPIAPAFNAAGEDWLAGITAINGPTQEMQVAPMIVRLRGIIPAGVELAPDIFMIDIEQN